MWVSDAIDSDLIQPSRARSHSGGPEAALEWLRYNAHGIPTDLLPPEAELPEFAAFFSTFLTSSFDVIEEPGTRGEAAPRGSCRCDLCVRIVNAPHLQSKKLYLRDKRRAIFLMAESIAELGRENGVLVEESLAQKLATNRAIQREAAYVSYGRWLIRRLSGESDGPAILALWRLIAWDPRGGMRRDFTLELNDFKHADKTILSEIERT